MKRFFLLLLAGLAALVPAAAQRLTVGGYGEVALTRNFYSDNVYRYSSAASHKGEQHGRFDVPHAVEAAASPEIQKYCVSCRLNGAKTLIINLYETNLQVFVTGRVGGPHRDDDGRHRR